MVAEKLWAKLKGSYAYAEGGSPAEVLMHLTNDPAQQFSNAARNWMDEDALWNKIKWATDRDYFAMAGTKGQGEAWVPGHAYSIISAQEL